MKYAVSLLATLIIFVSGLVPISYAQAAASISVTPHIEKGNEFFEIVGVGFPANTRVRISAVNKRTDEGVTLVATSDDAGAFSNVFIGKNADGQFFVVTAGTWRVKAKAGDVVARATFESRRRPADGTYAGDEAALRVQPTGTDIILACHEGRTIEPLFLDENGNFSAQATLVELRGPSQGAQRPARIDGSVQGNRITFTVTVLANDGTDAETFGPFEVLRGREPDFPRCV